MHKVEHKNTFARVLVNNEVAAFPIILKINRGALSSKQDVARFAVGDFVSCESR